MKLKIDKTNEYNCHDPIKDRLKAQAKLTAKQILEMFDVAEFNSSTGTKIPAYECIIEQLREMQ